MNVRATAIIAVAGMIAVGPASAAAAATTIAAPTATTAMAPTAAPSKPKPKVHYYIAQAADTKACSVVSKKPDGKTATMVGKYWYATEAKATSAMKHQAACKSA